MMIVPRRGALCYCECVLFALLLGAPGWAIAQTETEDSNPTEVVDTIPVPQDTPGVAAAEMVEFEALVITGDKLGRRQDEAAASLSVLTSDQLEEKGITNLAEALEETANAAPNVQGQFSIRGINMAGAIAGQTSDYQEAVSTIYLDGVALDRLARDHGGADLFDIAQVAVYRGPQATSLGRNGLAGAAVIETKDPGELFNGHLQLRPSQYADTLSNGEQANDFMGAVALGTPLSGGFGVRGVFDRRDTDGFLFNRVTGQQEFGRLQRSIGRMKMVWAPTQFDNWLGEARFALTASRIDSQRPTRAVFNRENNAPAFSAEDNTPNSNAAQLNLYALNLDVPVASGWRVQAVTAYTRSDQLAEQDVDYAFNHDSIYFTQGLGRTLTQELRVFYDGDALRFTAGAYYARVRDAFFGDILNVITELDDNTYIETDSAFDGDLNLDNRAVFGEMDWDFLPRWTLTLGLRYDRESRALQQPFTVTDAQIVSCISLGNCTPDLINLPDPLPSNVEIVRATGQLPSASNDPASSDYDALLPKVALRHAVTAQLSVYGSYAEGYRAGGASVKFLSGEIVPYEPEFTRNYELGLRWNDSSNTLRVSAGAFFIDWTDQQISVLDDDGNVFIINGGQSELRGGEFEGVWLPLGPYGPLRLFGNFGLALTEYIEFNGSEGDFSGKQFTFSPKVSGAIGAAWTPYTGLQAGVTLSHVADTFSDPSNTEAHRNKARSLLSARVGYSTGAWTLRLIGQNLTNRVYTLSSYPLPADSPNYGLTEPGRLLYYGAPQQVGLQVDYRF